MTCGCRKLGLIYRSIIAELHGIISIVFKRLWFYYFMKFELFDLFVFINVILWRMC